MKISKTEVISMNIVHEKHKITNVVPSSNLKTTAEEKFLEKINRQEKIVNAIKTALMPHFKRKYINKEEYKDILKKSVIKVSQSKDNDINPNKIKKLIEGYVERCNLFYANKMTKRTLK
jgi:PHD and RING finger domain-containing protein 1